MRSSPPVFLRGGLAAIAVLLALATTRGATPDSAERWLNHYYQNPQPERFVPAVFELSRAGWFEEPGHVPLAIGFVASVFQQNPEQVDGWLQHCRALPPAHQRLIVAALWYSGHAKGPGYLEAYARTTGAEVRTGLDRVLAAAPDLHGAEVKSSASAQLQWGVFLATGETAPVRSLLAALGTEGRLSAELRWFLARHAARHERVLAICRAELARQPNARQELLRAVINTAQSGRRPGTS